MLDSLSPQPSILSTITHGLQNIVSRRTEQADTGTVQYNSISGDNGGNLQKARKPGATGGDCCCCLVPASPQNTVVRIVRTAVLTKLC